MAKSSPTRLLPLLLLALASISASEAAPVPPPIGGGLKKPTVATTPPAPPVVRIYALPAGEGTERALPNNETHVYQVDLTAGQFLRAVVDQRGVDLAVQVVAPGGQVLFVVDGTGGDQGQEIVDVVARTTGRYELRVMLNAPITAKHPAYTAFLDRLGVPTARERMLSEAEELYHRAHKPTGTVDWESLAEDYRAATSLFVQLRDAPQEAHSSYFLGKLLLDHRDYAAAGSALQQAFRAASLAKVFPFAFTASNDLGVCYRRQNEFTKAREWYLAGLDIAPRTLDGHYKALALQNLGELDQQEGRTWAARTNLLAAMDLWHQLGLEGKQPAIETLTNLAWVYHYLQDTQNALGSYWTVLRRSNSIGASKLKLIALNQLGDLYREQGLPHTALRLLELAQKLASEKGDSHDVGAAYNNLGICLRSLGDYQAAKQAFRKSLDAFKNPKDLRGQASAWLNLGWVAIWTHRPEEARYNFSVGLKLGQQSQSLNTQAHAYTGLAAAEEQLKDLPQTQRLAEMAVATVELQSSTITRPDLQLQFLASLESGYELLIRVLMERNRQEPGSGFAERAAMLSDHWRARGLYDSLREQARAARSGSRDYYEKRRKLIVAINAGNLLLAKTGASPDQTLTAQRSLANLYDQLRELDAEARGRNPDAAPLQPAPPPSLETLRQRLPPSTVLLQYHLARHHSYLWVITTLSIQSFELDGSEVLEPAIRASIGDLFANPEAPWQAAADLRLLELSRHILAPIASTLTNERLLISADGALQYFPFDVLPEPTGGHAPLIEHHDIAYIPSLAVLAELEDRSANRPPLMQQSVALADPVFDWSDPRLGKYRSVDYKDTQHFLPRLDHSRQEADAIAALAPGTIEKLDFDATRELILDGTLAGHSLVHIAAHGVLRSDSPDQSALVLSRFDARGKPRYGEVRTQDLESIDLPADLVTLSACSMVLKSRITGEGLSGLPKGFLVAGARRVLVTLSEVKDNSTAELMKVFYQGFLKEKLSPSEALRQAQLALRHSRKWASPKHWAGFIVIGG